VKRRIHDEDEDLRRRRWTRSGWYLNCCSSTLLLELDEDELLLELDEDELDSRLQCLSLLRLLLLLQPEQHSSFL
jgi:hypothetical protein